MKKTIGGLLLLLAAGAASAQPEEERSRTAQAETPVSYVPKIDGAIKAKMEIDLNRGEYPVSYTHLTLPTSHLV